MRRRAPRGAGTAAALALVAIAPPAPAAAQRELLPDLDQAVPRELVVDARDEGAGRRFHLGFGSAVDNVGRGPLIIDGRRAAGSPEVMTAEQVVMRDGATPVRRPRVGELRFVRGGGHSHWHLLAFDRYELRSARDYRLVAPDAKTGFCLGDRYETDPARTLAGEPEAPVFNTNCGLDRPDLLALREGISPGWGDDYPPLLEGQSVDVTGVAAGDHFLVHRANPDRSLRESRYANNAASVLLRLSRRGGRPSVRVLASCPDAEGCARPLSLAAAQSAAARYVARRFRGARGLRTRCRRTDRVRMLCDASFAARGRRREVALSVRSVFRARRLRTLVRPS